MNWQSTPRKRIPDAPEGSFYYNCPKHICITSPYYAYNEAEQQTETEAYKKRRAELHLIRKAKKNEGR